MTDTNVLTEARSDAAEALSTIDGVKVYNHVPSKMVGPAVVVYPGDPYILPGKAMGEYQVALTVRLYARQATNAVITKAMDELIVQVLDALADWEVSAVNRPGVDRESYDTPFLVTDLTINTFYRKDVIN